MKKIFLSLCLSLFSLSAIAMPIPELVFGAAMTKYSLQLFAEHTQTNQANFMVSPFSPYQKLLGCQCKSHDAPDCRGALHLAETVLRESLAKTTLTVKTSTAIAIAKPLSDPHLMILFITPRSGVNFNDLKRQLDFKTYEFYIEHLHAVATAIVFQKKILKCHPSLVIARSEATRQTRRIIPMAPGLLHYVRNDGEVSFKYIYLKNDKWPPSPPYIVIIYDKTNDGIADIGQITQLNNE